VSRLVFVQTARWSKQIDGGNGGPVYVYSTEHCAYCARPVRPDATFLYTARTNDGEWWLVSADEALSGDEWRDFQTQLDGSRRPTLLPIGPDCLRKHPEFAFAIVTAATRSCAKGLHLGPVRMCHDRFHGALLEAWICERCGKDVTDEVTP
jgi:hypothetical protein